MPTEYGQHGPQQLGIVFSLGEGQALRDIDIKMAATGIISGRVVDAGGSPVGHVNVFALARVYAAQQEYLTIRQTVHTNERGEYRLFWLPPDEYFVAARIDDMNRRTSDLYVVPPGTASSLSRVDSPVVTTRVTPEGRLLEETYALVYNGGALNPAGTNPVNLEPGATVAGIDIPISVGTLPSYRIHGVVIDGVTGLPVSGAHIRAFPHEMSTTVQVLTATADKDGVFDLLGAVSGSYSVFATGVTRPQQGVQSAGTGTGNASENTTSGFAPAAIGGASVDLRIVTSAPIAVPGRVTIEGRPPSDNDPELAKVFIRIDLEPEVLGTLSRPVSDTPAVRSNGTFTRQLYPGDYRVRAVWGFAPNAYVKSIRMGSVDLLDDILRVTGPPRDPLEVTIGSDGGELTGVVVTQQSEPISNAVVAIVPESTAQRRRIDSTRSVTTDANGRFRLQGIPPGNYKLFAWEYAPFGASETPEFIQKYEALGKRIVVRVESKQDIEITAIPARK
jgi:hypothetical protein